MNKTQIGSLFDIKSLSAKSVHFTESSTVEVGNVDDAALGLNPGDPGGGAEGIVKPPLVC